MFLNSKKTVEMLRSKSLNQLELKNAESPRYKKTKSQFRLSNKDLKDFSVKALVD